MKKKISLIVLCGIVLLGICGCENKNTSNEGNNEENKLSSIKGYNIRETDVVPSYYQKVNVKCDEIKDIKDYYFGYFITNYGELYKFSYDKVFSDTDTNCKRINTNIKFIKFIDGGLLDENNNIYVIDKDDNLSLFTFQPGYMPMPYLNDIAKKEYINVSRTMKPNDNIHIYFYYSENKVYKLKDDFNTEADVEENAIFELKKDETISYIVDATIKTNKNFYIYKSVITNKDECNKYADIECNYENKFYEIPELSNKKFLFYKSGMILVDNELNVFLSGIGV